MSFTNIEKAILFVLASILVLNHLQLAAAYLTWDDAFISYRYALNWVNGKGPVYNEGERVEGYSNFLWIFLHKQGMRLGLHPISISYILGLGASLLSLWTVYRLGREWYRVPLLALVPCAVVVFDNQFNRWAMSGMETPLVNVLFLLGLWFLVKEHTGQPSLLRFHWKTALCFILLSMTRPEGIALGLVFLSAYSLFSYSQSKNFDVLKRNVLTMGVILLLWGVYFGWRWLYYGKFLPNSFYIKVGYTYEQIVRGYGYISECHAHIFLWPLLFLSLLFIYHRKEPVFKAMFSVICFHTLYLVAIGGDWMGLRFYTILVPLWALLAGGGLAVMLAFMKRKEISVTVQAILVLTLFSAYTYHQSLQYTKRLRDPLSFPKYPYKSIRQLGGKYAHDLANDMNQKPVRLVTSYGEVAYYSRLPILDPSGLNDPNISERPRTADAKAFGAGVPGHERYDFNYILTLEPELIYNESPHLTLGWRQPLYEGIHVPGTPNAYIFLRKHPKVSSHPGNQP